MLTDLRLAFRSLGKSRGSTLVAIITLATGLGATAAMFSVLNALVVHPFGYPESDRIAHIWSGDGWPLSEPDAVDIHTQATSFEEFGIYDTQKSNVGGDNPHAIRTARCTAGVLRTFGISPARGRLLDETDEPAGAPPAIVISHALWMSSFGGNPDLVGQTIRLNGIDTTVVGIMPESFEFVSPWMGTATCEGWTAFRPRTDNDKRDNHNFLGVGRLKHGTTVEAADAEIKAIGVRLAQEYPNTNTHKKFLVRSLHTEMTREIGPRVWMIFGAVTLVLVVACANVASLLLARSTKRQGEFGVRIALGAGRRDIVRLALAESLLLSAAGTVLGLLIAFGGVRTLQLITPVSETRRAAMGLDLGVVAFIGGLAVLTTLLAGLPPALAAARTSVASMLRDIGGRGCAGSRTRHHFLRGLIITQIAVALVLANAAVLFSSSYLKLLEANQEMATEYVVAAELNLRGERYKDNSARAQFWEQLADRVAAMPGVTAAGITSKLPLEGDSNTDILVNDEVFDPAAERVLAEVSSVTPGYFEAAGIGLLRGRLHQPGDEKKASLGVVINKTLADKCWPDKEPLGQLIRGNTPDPWFKASVIGVVENRRQWGPEEEPRPEMYFTPIRAWGQSIFLIVRSPQPALHLTPSLRQVIAELDPDLPLARVRTLQQVVDEATQGQRMIAGLINFFMVAAIGLVGVGLYGTLSYHVSQRTREIGVRMALGAFRGDITQLIMRQGVRWMLVGIVIGTAGALLFAWLVHSFAYGASSFNPVSLLAACVVVAIATAVACLVPALRASRVHPIEALRTE